MLTEKNRKRHRIYNFDKGDINKVYNKETPDYLKSRPEQPDDVNFKKVKININSQNNFLKLPSVKFDLSFKKFNDGLSSLTERKKINFANSKDYFGDMDFGTKKTTITGQTSKPNMFDGWGLPKGNRFEGKYELSGIKNPLAPTIDGAQKFINDVKTTFADKAIADYLAKKRGKGIEGEEEEEEEEEEITEEMTEEMRKEMIEKKFKKAISKKIDLDDVANLKKIENIGRLALSIIANDDDADKVDKQLNQKMMNTFDELGIILSITKEELNTTTKFELQKDISKAVNKVLDKLLGIIDPNDVSNLDRIEKKRDEIFKDIGETDNTVDTELNIQILKDLHKIGMEISPKIKPDNLSKSELFNIANKYTMFVLTNLEKKIGETDITGGFVENKEEEAPKIHIEKVVAPEAEVQEKWKTVGRKLRDKYDNDREDIKDELKKRGKLHTKQKQKEAEEETLMKAEEAETKLHTKKQKEAKEAKATLIQKMIRGKKVRDNLSIEKKAKADANEIQQVMKKLIDNVEKKAEAKEKYELRKLQKEKALKSTLQVQQDLDHLESDTLKVVQDARTDLKSALETEIMLYYSGDFQEAASSFIDDYNKVIRFMNDINNKEITKDNPIRKIVKHISILGNPKGFFNGNETKLDSSNGRKGIRERFNEEIKPTLELKINKLKKIVSPTKATAIPKSKFGTGQTVTMNDLSNSMDTLNISTTPPPQKKESKKSSKTGK